MLHEALRLIRVFHDLSQTEAASQLEISKSYLSEIEKGKKAPSLEIIDKYSRVFEIPASSILFFSENIDRGGSYAQAKSFVASKIVSIMQFLEHRSGRVHAE